MNVAELFAQHLPQLLVWGLIATVAMTTILQGSQGLGLSRLSLPFLVGTFFTSNRNRATVIGFLVYTIGGWGFAMLYFLFFAGIGLATWWLGALLGFLHGLFLLAGVGGLVIATSGSYANNSSGCDYSESSCADGADAAIVGGLAIWLGSWIYSMVDASAAARQYNTKYGLANAGVRPMVSPAGRGRTALGLSVAYPR